MKDDVMVSEPDRPPEELAPFLSAAKPFNRLSSDQGRKIKARALESLVSKPSHGFRWRWSMALAAVGLVLGGAAMAAAAARYGLLPWAARPQVQEEKPKSRGRIPVRIREQKPEAVEPAVTPAPVVPPKQVPEQPAQVGEPPRLPSGRRAGAATASRERTLARRSPSRLAREPLAETPVTEQPTAVTEQSVLSEALRRLRQEKDAAGALVLLDKLETSHPRSLLALERANMQVEALLALGREEEALSRLDGMALDALPRSAERYLLRGELRARFQHWSAARDDFEHALSQGSGTPVWHERALWGRGLARMRAGDRAGGEADLKRYLATYPQGRHATEAVRLLPPSR